MATSGTQTFDVFLSHNSRDKPVVERVARKLKQVGLEPFLDKWCLTPGGNWQDELAAGLNASLACAVFIGPSGLGDWVRMELDVATDRAAKDHSFRLFLVLLPGLPEPFDFSSLPPFLRMRTWVDLRAGTEDARAFQSLVNAVKGVPLGPEVPIEPSTDVCPYRGLQAFDEEHAEFYFGREGDVQRLIEKLKEDRFLAVVGPSGSGKSSLVRAGLIPALRTGALPTSEAWAVRVFTPTAQPLTALATQLLRLYEGESMHRTLDALRDDARTLHLAVALALADRTPAERVVWVVDQSEEVFTLCRDEQERAQFLANLLYAASIPEGRCIVVLTLRADFYPHCAAYPELSSQFATRQYLVSPMELDGLRRVIEEPAWRVGLEFEAGLVDTILDDVFSQPGALPLLEHALLELWERRRGRLLTLEGYRDSGGVHGAIAKRADAIFRDFTPAEQEIARNLLLRLTQPGEGTADTRRQAAMDELVTLTGSRETVERVVARLVDARLLTTSITPQVPERYVNVSHEALIRGWPRLQEWINEDRDGLRVHHQLAEAAHEWQRTHDEGVLYRGARLAAAIEWRERNKASLNELEWQFLQASEALQTRERLEAQRRVRRTVGGLLAALVIISSVAVFAFVQRQQAVQARQVAVRAQLAAVQAQRIATSRELAASALAHLGVDPELGLLLAIQSARVAHTSEAEDALRQSLLQSHVRTVFRRHQGPVDSAAFSPAGTRVVTAGDDGTARVWSARTGTVLAALRGHTQRVNSATFSPDGRLVVTASDDGTARVWNAATGQSMATLSGHQDIVTGAAFSPDGRLIVTASADGTARIWDAATGRSLHVLKGRGLGTTRASFSPDGTRVLMVGPDNAARVWDARTGTLLHALSAVAMVRSAAFSPDGRLIVTAHDDGSARLWSARTGAALAVLRGHAQRVNSAAFSPDGRLVVTASDDGTARVWNAATGGNVAALLGHLGAVTGAAFSADSALVVTVGADNTARVWDARSGDSLGVLRGHTAAINGVAFSPHGSIVVTASADGTARVWDANTQSVLTHLLWRRGTATAAAFSPDGRLVAIANGDQTAGVWEARSGKNLAVLRGHAGAINSVAFSPDGAAIVSASDDHTARVWSARSGRSLLVLGGHAGAVNSAAFSPDGRYIVTASGDATARIWDARSGKRRLVLSGHSGPVNSAAFSPNGRLVLTLGADLTAGVWDVRSGQRLVTAVNSLDAAFSADGRLVVRVTTHGTARVFETRSGSALAEFGQSVTGAAFSPDSKYVVTGSDPGSVELWEVGTWKDLGVLSDRVGHKPRPTFSSDGRFLLVASADRGVSVWDVGTRQNLANLRDDTAAATGAAFSRDDRLVLTTSADGAARVYACDVCGPIDDLVALARGRVTRSLTPQERAQYLHTR